MITKGFLPKLLFSFFLMNFILMPAKSFAGLNDTGVIAFFDPDSVADPKSPLIATVLIGDALFNPDDILIIDKKYLDDFSFYILNHFPRGYITYEFPWKVVQPDPINFPRTFELLWPDDQEYPPVSIRSAKTKSR